MTTVSAVREQEVVTVTLPPPDTRTSLSQRLSLRLALWLLLRSERAHSAPVRTRAPRPRRVDHVSAPHPDADAAATFAAYSVLRHLR